MKKKNCHHFYVKRLCKLVSIFLALLLVLTAAWNGLYIHRNYDEDRITGFFREPKNSLDVVLIGASDISRAFCPGLAYKEYGITSYPFTINGDAVQVWQAQLDETLKRQHPDVIVIEVNGALYSSQDEEEYHMYQTAVERMALHLPLLSGSRISLIDRYVASTGKTGDFLRLLFPLYEYHSNQPGGIRSALATIRSNILFSEDNEGVLTLRGFETVTGKTQIGELVPDIEKSDKTEELDPAYEKALRRFLSHCRKRHPKTNLLFVRTPHLFEKNNAYMQKVFYRTNRIGQVIEEYGYPFLNFEKRKQEVGINDETDFYDANHLNVSGMKKFTAYFSRYLLEHGVTPRKLTEKERKQWEHTAQYTELFLQYYDRLQKEGSNGKDLFESPEMLEILHGMDLKQAQMEKRNLSAAGTGQTKVEKKETAAARPSQTAVEKKEMATAGPKLDFVQCRKTEVTE